MDLYVFPPAPSCLKVIALAHHLKLKLNLKEVNVPRGEQKAREFLELNRNGRLPLLVDGAFKLWESDAILIYLAEKAHSTMMPRHPAERADVLRWMFWGYAHLGPATGILLYENVARELLDLGEPDPAEVRRGHDEAEPLLQCLQHHFEEQDYVCGQRLSVADFSLAACFVYHLESGLALEPYRDLQGWYERIVALPAWQEAQKYKPRIHETAHHA
jgi:glutathione S-transferase